jgi:transcriptional regulator with XRE-family HTH domain
MSLLQNQHMVDLTGLPYPPDRWPDPRTCKDFPEWLRGLTEFGGVTQRQIAQVAGATPQAVTKWLKGGAIEVERLARLSEWSGQEYRELRRLVDEPKIRILPTGVAEPRTPYLNSHTSEEGARELLTLWSKLSADARQQLLGMAKLLASKRAARRK